MGKVDRKSAIDARRIMGKCVKDEKTRIILVDFLSSAIVYANNLRPENWNLNLDINGKFIRFNVGQEYCIEINDERTLVLCIRGDLENIFVSPKKGIRFRGHHRGEIVDNENSMLVPDCLALTKDSAGCLIEHDKLIEYLPLLKQTNFNFISKAQRTCLRTISKRAHSVGCIEYLSNVLKKDIPNPLYVYSETDTKSMK